jgi:formyl-CoA transferase
MGNMAFVSTDGENGKAGYARLTGGGRRVVPTSDGYISLLPYTPKHWRNFFEALGRQDLLDQFKVDSRSALNANISNLYATLMALGPTKTTQDWVRLCETIDIPVTPVYALDDLPEHPQLKAVGLFEETEHPTEGWLRQVRPSLLVDGVRPAIRNHAPNLGADTEEVLREAGLTDDQIKVCLSAFPASPAN